jgi:hypothetical protein
MQSLANEIGRPQSGEAGRGESFDPRCCGLREGRERSVVEDGGGEEVSEMKCRGGCNVDR